MVIKLYCPQYLDIAAVIKSKPFKNGKKLKTDHLHFIIHCILRQRASMDDEHLEKIGKYNGFVPLHSKILQSKIPKYHDCIEYLIHAGIIECDGKFANGKVSKGYRLTGSYTGNDFKQIEINDFALCKKIVADKPFKKQTKAARDYPYLAKWFKTEKLEIDEAGSLQLINDFEARELLAINNDKRYSAKKRLKKKLSLHEKYRNYKILVSRIKEKDYFLHKDDTGNRLHTNLTNLPKGLRQFLTYDGQNLVAIDIKNSQPYMSLPLLGKDFWQSQNLAEKPNLKRIHKELYEKTGRNKKEKNSIIKFIDSSKTLTSIDFQKERFFKSVVTGCFYEFLIDILEKGEGLYLGRTAKEKRDKVKKIILTLLFDDNNKVYNKKHDSPSQIFKRIFPSVANIFEYVKKWDYCDLAILLQRIESYLLLERICNRIAEERPFVPIFTIHDSIVTTVGNEDYVKSVMKEELENSIGTAPQFSVEYWQKPILRIAQAA